MNLWPFGRRAPEKLDSAPVPAIDPKMPPGDGSSALRTHFVTQIYGRVTEIIGKFNPKAVTMADRLLMRFDPDVHFGLSVLRATLINAQWSVESKDPKIKAFIEAQFRKDYRPIAASGSLAIGLGYQVTEKVWRAGPATIEIEDKVGGTTETVKLPMAWIFDRFKTIDPRTIVLHVNEATDEWDGVQQYMALGTTLPGPVTLVGPERVALWSYGKEESFGRLTGFPMLNVAYSDWWDKSAIGIYANRYFETKGDPTLIGRANMDSLKDANGDNVDGFSFMGGILKFLKSGSGVVLPSTRDDKGNLEYDVDFLKDDKRGDQFENYLKYKGDNIKLALLLPPRVGGIHAGSGLGTKDAGVQQDQHSEFLESIQYSFFSESINPQFVDPMVLYNFGPEALEQSKTRLVPAGLSASVKMLLRDVLFKGFDEEMTLGSGKSIPLFKRFDAPAILRELDVPMPSAEDLAALEKEQEQINADAQAMQDAAAAAPPSGPPPPDPALRD